MAQTLVVNVHVLVEADRVTIAVILNRIKLHVGHAQLFTLVNVRGALHEVQGGRQLLSGQGTELIRIITEAGDNARLVVVVPVQRTPGVTLQGGLPVVQDALELGQLVRCVGPLAAQIAVRVVIHAHVIEVEDHVQLTGVVASPQLSVLGAGRAGLAHGHHVVAAEGLAGELLHPRVHHGAVRDNERNRGSVLLKVGGGVIRVALGLGDDIDSVQAEAVNALVQPPADHGVQVLANLLVLPVQVGLFLEEDVQVELAGRLVPLPRRAAELGRPVVRRDRVAVLVEALRVLPNVVVAVGVVLRGARFLEPGVLIRGVVCDQVHQNLDAVLVGGFKHLVEVFHGAEVTHNREVVRDVVAVVHVRRVEHGGEPDDVDAQLSQVGQLLGNALQITDTVAVSVVEGAGVHLVHHGFLPPLAAFVGGNLVCLGVAHNCLSIPAIQPKRGTNFVCD